MYETNDKLVQLPHCKWLSANLVRSIIPLKVTQHDSVGLL
uniref:Uncharacterized protein n=1 Tax=Arundo donax TaxID=35708 RepID=A0A0A9FC44_ARUDO